MIRVGNTRRNPFDRGIQPSGFHPRSIFAATTIGAIYAYDDFAYLNQKSDGSTPVTALEQPVGLVVDQRWGGLAALSATELVTNGGPFTATTGWSAFRSTLSVVDSKLRVTEDGVNTAGFGRQSFAVTAGRMYRISVDVSGITASKAQVWVGSSAGSADWMIADNITTARTVTRFFFATTTTAHVDLVVSVGAGGTTEYADFTNISVRELPGLHAYQSTDAARPVLKGAQRYANFDGTDDRLVTATGGGSTTGFLLVTGINVGGAGTARTIFSDRGTNTGYKVEVDAANNLVFTAGNGASFVSCTGPAITAGTSYVIACWHDGTNLNIKVGSGAVTSQAFATASAGTAAISIGRDNGAATGFYNGRLYPTVYIKDSTAGVGAINATMAWVAGKGGIAL